MATYKKQLRDKDGNTIYPDVGLDLDNVVYSDDPSENIGDVIDPNSYSTTEKWTGGYWIDNKKIYKKTINFGALPNNTQKSVNHNISNLDWVVKVECFAKDAYGNRLSMPTPSTNPVTLNVRDTDILVVTTSDRSSYTQTYCTIYYTKTS